MLSSSTRSAWPRLPVRTVSFAYTSLPGESVCEFVPTMPSASGLVEVAVPIRDWAFAAVDCIANKPINSSTGVHLRSMHSLPLQSPWLLVPVRFQAISKMTTPLQYLYVTPAVNWLATKSPNATFDCTVVYW